MIRCLILGPTGVGKSTHGKFIAKLRDYTFLDLDKLIEQHIALPLAQALREKGPQWLWQASKQQLDHHAQTDEDCVMAVGAGTQYAAPQSWQESLRQAPSLALLAEAQWLWELNRQHRQDPRAFEAFYSIEYSPLRQQFYSACRWQLDLTHCSVIQAQTQIEAYFQDLRL